LDVYLGDPRREGLGSVSRFRRGAKAEARPGERLPSADAAQSAEQGDAHPGWALGSVCQVPPPRKAQSGAAPSPGRR